MGLSAFYTLLRLDRCKGLIPFRNNNPAIVLILLETNLNNVLKLFTVFMCSSLENFFTAP